MDNYQKTFNNVRVQLIHSISIAHPRKIKVDIRFSFDTQFIFDFDVCVGIEENVVLNQEVA